MAQGMITRRATARVPVSQLPSETSGLLSSLWRANHQQNAAKALRSHQDGTPTPPRLSGTDELRP
jgi:hypothetical protein